MCIFNCSSWLRTGIDNGCGSCGWSYCVFTVRYRAGLERGQSVHGVVVPARWRQTTVQVSFSLVVVDNTSSAYRHYRLITGPKFFTRVSSLLLLYYYIDCSYIYFTLIIFVTTYINIVVTPDCDNILTNKLIFVFIQSNSGSAVNETKSNIIPILTLTY